MSKMETSTQLKHLLRFELLHFSKRKWTAFLVPLFFIAFGIFAGSSAGARPMENTFKNGTFSITYILGLLSLINIYTATIIAAQVLFREKDARFSLLLYSTQIRKSDYLLSRFLIVFGITVLSYFLFTLAFALGQFLSIDAPDEYGVFQLWFYIQPFLLLAIPNAIFCSAIICLVGWLSQNKLLIYVSGLFIYIFYMVTLIFSSSPLMGGGFPSSPEAIDMAARFDPFGLSAFFQQTLQWTAFQRNNQLISLEGNMLFNRIFIIGISIFALLFLGYKFQFSLAEKSNHEAKLKDESLPLKVFYKAVLTEVNSLRHLFKSMVSFINLDLKFIVKSIPFVLILIGLGFILSMEIYAEIEKGIRLPQKYASTELMINTILETFPAICIIVLLFYGNELIWRTRDTNFHLIEDSTPIILSVKMLSKWISLSIITLIFLIWTLIISVIFQLSYQYYLFDFAAYLSLFYVVGVPIILSCGLIVSTQYLFKNKYLGLVISTIFTFLAASNLGRNVGLTHPLFRFTKTFVGEISAFNSFGGYLFAFTCRMLFGFCVTLSVFFMVAKFRQNRKFQVSIFQVFLAILLVSVSIFSGLNIHNHLELEDEKATLDWQQNYEKKYRKYANLLQPTIIDIQTNIDLFPERNSYKVKAIYTFQNKTDKPIERLLFYVSDEIKLKKLTVSNTKDSSSDRALGHHWFVLQKPLQPNEKISTEMEFDYTWNPFTKHTSFNAIVENGSFMRISNYFPSLGYQSDNEISDKEERKNRKLGSQRDVLSLGAARKTQHDFIHLESIISTSKDQIALGVGELVKQWTKAERSYFHYKTTSLIPPRFAVSSAKYLVVKKAYRGINIEVYFHPSHFENVNHLIENATKTLDYCEVNFGKYPFKTIRFAEISSLTRGFAATAYPATIFMAEDMIFHANIKADKKQDVINELAGHELSHEWWGANQLSPDEREGAKLLTETLAMYTELMLVKKMYGAKRVLENVRMHQGIYLSVRGLTDEQPLFKTRIENAHQHYSKGLVVMYQLSELIGEEKINLALRNLFKKYANSNLSPISTDLLDKLYAVSEPKYHAKIDEFFKQITTYDIEIQTKSAVKNNAKYAVNIVGKVNKYYENGKGIKTNVVLNDSVEVAVYFKNGVEKKMKTDIIRNQISFKNLFDEKPLKIIIDPREQMIKLSENNVVGF